MIQTTGSVARMNAQTTVYPARLVRTMDPVRPTAEAVAVTGDRIRAVGTLEELAALPNAVVDDRFADDVLFPGFVEAHTHPFGGALWDYPHLGYYESTGPDGTRWPGLTTLDAVVERLQQADRDLPEGEPLFAWGLDPIFYPGERLDRRHLDRVSATRPIAVLHRSAHLMTVNSAVLAADGITRDTAVEGVVKGLDGEPNGELQEPAAMGLVAAVPALAARMMGDFDVAGWRNFAADARNHGVTTLTDLGNARILDPGYLADYRAAAEDPQASVRVHSFWMGTGVPGGAEGAREYAAGVRAIGGTTGDLLHVGHVKLVLDGSIQGFTARLQAPGYLPDGRRGIWVMAPEQFREIFSVYHQAGLTVHVHCNGDEATELFLDVLTEALAAHPRWDHRHTVTHSQLSTPAQYRRMAALGVSANIFANHLWYWGDQHHDLILGADRACRMDAAQSALDAGVPLALHCDSPVTPIDPLATASYAAERRTPSGRVLGEAEQITVPQALYAVTLGPAWMLKMDHLVGSIEAGKFADFAVLDADPYTATPAGLRAITVRGSVLGGRERRLAR